MSSAPPEPADRAAELNIEIERFERAAIGMAMSGQWTAESDAKLAAMYEARRALLSGKRD